MFSLTRGAVHRISNHLRTVHSPASRHPLGVDLKRLGSPVGLQTSRIHLRLPARATSSSAAGMSSLGKKRTRRFVTTLDPGRLRSEDLLNLSGLVLPNIGFPCKEAPAFGSSYDTARLVYRYTPLPRGIVPFPANTQGFLYFHQSPHSHPAAGEVRFRVVRPEDLGLPTREAFSRGSDLTLGHRHSLWNIHLTVVFTAYPAMWRKLRDDGIITPIRAAEMESYVPKRLGPGRRWSRVLDSITQPFILGLGNCQPWALILHREGIFKGRVYIYLECHSPHRPRTISGKALVRFEMVNLPRKPGASESIPKVVLRVLEIVEPPNAEDAEFASQIFPEGQLAQRHDLLTKTILGPWSPSRKSEDRFITPTSRKLLEETYLGATKPGTEA